MFAILLSVLASADLELAAQKKVEEKEEPAGQKAPPRFVLVKLQGDKLVHRTTVTEFVPVTKEIEVDDNGKKVKKQITEYQTRLRQVEVTFDPKKAAIATAGGKKLNLDDLKKRLARPQVVVVSGDGKAVDEAYLKLLDKDAIVIVPEAPTRDKEKEK